MTTTDPALLCCRALLEAQSKDGWDREALERAVELAREATEQAGADSRPTDNMASTEGMAGVCQPALPFGAEDPERWDGLS